MHRRLFACALIFLSLAGYRGDRGAGTAGTGGTLIIAAPGDADVLLPPVATTQLAAHVIQRIFPRLAELKLGLNTLDDSGFTPVLARRWEHRDAKTIVFHLDPRARWQDGVPITSADVVYTFGVYRDSLTASPYRVNLDPIASVTAPDAGTVVFTFRTSYPEQLYDATYQLLMLPKHLLGGIRDDSLASSAFARHPVGAGPFHFGHWEAGTEISVEADTTWFLGRPHLDRIVWRVMPDVAASVSALLAGDADAIEFVPQRDQIERAARDTMLRLVPYPSPFIGGLIFNLRRPLFADRAMRRAIGMAVDRETIVRSVFGPWGETPIGFATRMQWIASGTVRQLRYDTAEASRLLDSLGWRRGAGGMRQRAGQPLEFTVVTPTTSRIRQEVATLIQNQLAQAGISLKIQPLEVSVFDQRTAAGDFEAMMFSRTLDPSPGNMVQFWASSSVGGENFGAYRSPAFDSLLAAATRSRGRTASLPKWHAVLERLNLDAPALFLYTPRNNAAIHRRFENVTIRPDSWLATVATWSVAPDRRLPRDR
ncbi:MAG TPA: peptide ABC transporter substrate-binding protein [Gemmatimonadales bacterium]